MKPRILNGLSDLQNAVGEHLGFSAYVPITQERVDTFAEATGDHQWIHQSGKKAADGPFGGPIAHGYLTLSLGPMLYRQIVSIEGFTMDVIYGTNRVRFPAPVPVGSDVRLGIKLLEVQEIPSGAHSTMEFTFECKGDSKPCCVQEILFRSLL